MLVGAAVASVATLVPGYATGIGFGALVERFRTAAIDSVFDDRGDDRVIRFRAMITSQGKDLTLKHT